MSYRRAELADAEHLSTIGARVAFRSEGQYVPGVVVELPRGPVANEWALRSDQRTVVVRPESGRYVTTDHFACDLYLPIAVP
jgi:hypothetical protein